MCDSERGVVTARRTYDTQSIALRRIYAYDISNNMPFSTGFVLTSLTKGLASFVSPNVTLSTIGFPDLPATISTLSGEAFSTAQFISLVYSSTIISYLPSTVAGLGTAGYLSSAVVESPINSSIIGLATSGYVSSTQLTSSLIGLGTIGYISSSQLTSSLLGLATIGFVSSTQLTSSLVGLATLGYVSSSQLFSSVNSLASLGYVSSTQLTSTVGGLSRVNYISTTQLTSTVAGLATIGYLSTNQIFRSTYSNTLLGNWSNVAFLQSSITTSLISISTIRFDMGASLRNQINSNTTKLDIECKQNLQFVYYDATSRNYQFNTFLVRGPQFSTPNIIGQESITYYILNANPINLAFFFQEKSRFLITNPVVLSTLRNDAQFTTLSLHHTFGPNVPTTNQFYATPASSVCASVVLDNTV